MSGVQNDYNASSQGDPRTRIGNWVEERALRAATGESRGSAVPSKSTDTATRITGPVLSERDYTTTTRQAHRTTLHAPHGPAFVAAVAQPRRAQMREAERAALAAAIVAERQAAEDAARQQEILTSTYGGKEPQNRRRALADNTGRTVEDKAKANPLMGTGISFHTHNIDKIHGLTPSDKGVHTFSKDTTFSKPLAETYVSGER